MKKKLLALLMGLALVLLLAACGGGGDDQAADNGGDAGGETTEDAGGADAGTDAGGEDAAGGDAGTDAGGEGATASAGDAEKLFSQKCSSCHGGNLEGGVGPELTAVGGKYSQEEIEGIIANGQGAMPGGLLQGDEASAVAEWLAAKK